ncbi:hypothetical protein KPH14_005722 [Odynerus spinipes]|uniref:Gag protein n=1 Tax=Odynerus spinipes TaxID=1348599 RepID=A0AAD9RAW0_9HYME|nr:hypothetical protein KPH14_005722 [Odynerus spinipes]
MQNSTTVDSNSTVQNVCEPFTFSKPDLWPEWVEQFDQFLLTANLNCKSDKEKIDLLCYTMGSTAKEILMEIKPDYATGASYEEIKTEFSKYFVVKKHVVIERDRFNNRTKQPNETIDAFISDLLRMVGKCAYGSIENRKLRERIFLGIKHSETMALMQAMPTFTLKEPTAKEKEEIEKKEEDVSMEIVKKRQWQPRLSNRHFYWQLPYHVQSKNCQGKNCDNCHRERRIDKWCNKQTVQNDVISDLNKQAEKLCIQYNDSKVDS